MQLKVLVGHLDVVAAARNLDLDVVHRHQRRARLLQVAALLELVDKGLCRRAVHLRGVLGAASRDVEAHFDEELVLGEGGVVVDHLDDRLILLRRRLRNVLQRHLQRLLAVDFEADVVVLHGDLPPVPTLVRERGILDLEAKGSGAVALHRLLVLAAEAVELVQEAAALPQLQLVGMWDLDPFGGAKVSLGDGDDVSRLARLPPDAVCVQVECPRALLAVAVFAAEDDVAKLAE